MQTSRPIYTAQAHIQSPLGPVLIARTAAGLAGLWFEAQKWHPGPLCAPEHRSDPLLQLTTQQLAEYFAGHRTTFELTLDLHGTAFQKAIWNALLGIACGGTRSYVELARTAGHPEAVRAVGAAIGRNPVSVIVPCHRVVGQDGSLTGYAAGLDRKRELLARERSCAV